MAQRREVDGEETRRNQGFRGLCEQKWSGGRGRESLARIGKEGEENDEKLGFLGRYLTKAMVTPHGDLPWMSVPHYAVCFDSVTHSGSHIIDVIS